MLKKKILLILGLNVINYSFTDGSFTDGSSRGSVKVKELISRFEPKTQKSAQKSVVEKQDIAKSDREIIKEKVKSSNIFPSALCELVTDYVAPSAIKLELDPSIIGDVTFSYARPISSDADINKSIENELARLRKFDPSWNKITLAEIKTDENNRNIWWQTAGIPSQYHYIIKKLCPQITFERKMYIDKNELNLNQIEFKLKLPDSKGNIKDYNFAFLNPNFSFHDDESVFPKSFKDGSFSKYKVSLGNASRYHKGAFDSSVSSCAIDLTDPDERSKAKYALCIDAIKS